MALADRYSGGFATMPPDEDTRRAERVLEKVREYRRGVRRWRGEVCFSAVWMKAIGQHRTKFWLSRGRATSVDFSRGAFPRAREKPGSIDWIIN